MERANGEAREATTSMVCWGRLQGLHGLTAGVSARTTPSQHSLAIQGEGGQDVSESQRHLPLSRV